MANTTAPNRKNPSPWKIARNAAAESRSSSGRRQTPRHRLRLGKDPVAITPAAPRLSPSCSPARTSWKSRSTASRKNAHPGRAVRLSPDQRRAHRPAAHRSQPEGPREGGPGIPRHAQGHQGRRHPRNPDPEIEVEVSPLEIPDSIRVNVEHWRCTRFSTPRRSRCPEGAKLVDYAEKIICQVRTVKEEVAAVAAEAGPAEPEVIGKKKEEEGAEGAAPAEAGKGAAPAKAAAPAAAAKK